MLPARPTGYPTYILIGWLFERLPFSPFWNLGLFSALSTVGTCLFIFLTIKFLTHKSLSPYIGAAVYAGSFLVWTQSVIPITYTFTTLLAVAGTYFILKRKYWTACGLLALGLGTHHLIVLAIIPLIVYVWYTERDMKLVGKLMGFGCLGFITYLQTLVFTKGGTQTNFTGNLTPMQTLYSLGFAGQLPLVSTPMRLWESGSVFLTSMSIGLVLLLYLKRSKEVALLATLASLPIVYYFVSFIPHWVRYMVPGMAFLSILIGIGAANFPYRKVLPVFLVIPLCLLGWNAITYDIGKSVDPLPTTARRFHQQLEDLPDGSLVFTYNWGYPWIGVHYYSHSEPEKGLIVINQGAVVNYGKQYRVFIEEKGVELPIYNPDGIGTIMSVAEREKYTRELALLNPSREVYIAEPEEGIVGETRRFDTINFCLNPVSCDYSYAS